MAKQAPPPKQQNFLDRFKLGIVEKRKQQIDEAAGWAEPTPAQKQDGTTPYVNRRKQENLK